jgi:hypothetical protein
VIEHGSLELWWISLSECFWNYHTIITFQGPMLWFFKHFRQNIRRKNWRIWLKTKLNSAKFWS